ncbi:hypothetical protein VNO78_15041 [Psophocarpus tetragonolobus]|uniref:Homeobox-leucine zipper protein n=1 Tax=Psophocarpus tetragonolobus TaxID=3891 RepID=A0AAN9XIU4_PSOTE
MAFPPSHCFTFHTHEEQHHHHLPSASLNAFPSLPPLYFQEDTPFMLKRSMSFSGIEKKCDEVNGDDEFSDDGMFKCGEKKKRLNMKQVKALEKSFELGNKLEPERKMQLAKALGLQPRQIAIWFQNRRARWKTKQLEKEYEVLKKQFEAVKADNDVLKVQNQKLQAELQAVKSRDCCEAEIISLKKETEGSWSKGRDINLDFSRTLGKGLNNSISCQNGKNLLPNSFKPTSITQLLQDDGFCDIFHNIDAQQNFWPWSDQQHHHFH